jgi:hypothetical protein
MCGETKMNGDWKLDIINLMNLKQTIKKLDVRHQWLHYFPEVAATEYQLIEVEKRLGYGLDPIYRGFLTYANGWKGFYQTVHLFGTRELKGSMLMKRAEQLLQTVEQPRIEKTEFAKADFLPIAASPIARELFVITKSESQAPGVVIGFSAAESMMFFDFREFFLGVTVLNRDIVHELRAGDAYRNSLNSQVH